MSDHSDDRQKHQQLDGTCWVIRGVLNGLLNSGFVSPLLLLGAVNSVLHRAMIEHLQSAWVDGGRAQYEDAKVAVLNLATMTRLDLDAFIRTTDDAITKTELAEFDALKDADPHVKH